MVSNLTSRGIHLQTLQKFENLAAQRLRLQSCGFVTSQNATDTDYIWRKWVSEEEKERVSKCEMLDEIEEWILLAKHYCVVWGSREAQSGGIFDEAWSNLAAQQDE
jgi:[phosphatase 2A protein]-leucine-carboxy methyltransferase